MAQLRSYNGEQLMQKAGNNLMMDLFWCYFMMHDLTNNLRTLASYMPCLSSVIRVRALDLLDLLCAVNLPAIFYRLLDFIEDHERRRLIEKRCRANYEDVFPEIKRDLIEVVRNLALVNNFVCAVEDSDPWSENLTVLCKTFQVEVLLWCSMAMDEMRSSSLRPWNTNYGIHFFRGRSLISFFHNCRDGLNLAQLEDTLPSKVLEGEESLDESQGELSPELGVCGICRDAFIGRLAMPLEQFKRQYSSSICCRNVFHSLCLFQWLSENRTCPLCRTEQTIDFRSGVAENYFEEWRLRISRFAKLNQRGSIPLRSRQQSLLRYLKAGDVRETRVNLAGSLRIRTPRYRQQLILRFLRRKNMPVRWSVPIMGLRRVIRRFSGRH